MLLVLTSGAMRKPTFTHSPRFWTRRERLRGLGEALGNADLESLDQQLCQLQGDTAATSVVTSRQLRWTCCLEASVFATQAVGDLGTDPQGELTHDAQVAAQTRVCSATTVRQLEPQNPVSLHFVGSCLKDCTATSYFSVLATSTQLKLEASQAAIGQRQYLRALRYSSSSLSIIGQLLALGDIAAPSRSTARAEVESFQEAEAGYLPIKRLLPEQWVAVGKSLATMARQALPRVMQYVAEGGPPLQSTAAQSSHIAAGFAALAEQLQQAGDVRCAGCGTAAQGLRKCSRCRQAGYCR